MGNPVEPIGQMTPYSAEHIVALMGTVIVTTALILIARRLRGTAQEDRFLQVAGWLMLLVTFSWMIWGMLPSQWNIDQSLPLHYSDALRLITSLALLTRTGWAVSICYFWGLTLNLQSIITPDLNYFDYPFIEYVVYWFLHIMAFAVPIVFVGALGYRPTWRGFGFAYLATVAWACLVVGANGLTGANYGYLSRGPEGPSILDLLGPWPLYILWEAVIIAVVWALMTWPLQTIRTRKAPVIDKWATMRRREISSDLAIPSSAYLPK